MIDIRLSDNLELMAEMQDNTVDLIYCDILYGTGRKFKDYQDLKPKREIIEKHYIPRIKEMHRVLKDTGSIYLQMDTRINHWIRCILDDVFGYDNFLNEIIWEYPKGIKNSTLKQINNHDNIFHYKKEKYYHNIVLNDYTKKQLSRFNKIDENGKYYYDTRRDKSKNKYKVKVYLKKTGTPTGDVWYFNFEQGNNRLDYDTQKPKKLIERIIKASSNEGDLVADFYGGSFTTAEVCKDLNRNFIGCDISEKAVQIGRARVSGGF